MKYITRSFPGGSNGKEFAYSAEDPGSIPGMGRSLGEGNGNPFQYFLPGVFHRQWSLVGYSPYHKFMIYEIINYSLRSERVYQGP